MKFNDKYPDACKPTYTLRKDQYYAPGLIYCGRMYPCGCGIRTGWRYDFDGIEVTVCSEECVEKLIAQSTVNSPIALDSPNNYTLNESSHSSEVGCGTVSAITGDTDGTGN